jgi:glutamate racemase
MPKNRTFKVGVFDSGIGGLSVANAIKAAHPELSVIFKDDSLHMPYGTKTNDQILAFCLPVLQKLAEEGVDIIVVACNTVSTNLIGTLRNLLPMPLIAMEPMVKPAAAATKSKIIAVCATPRTLASDRYRELKNTYAKDVTVLEPDCSDWSSLIENDQMNEARIKQAIEPVLEQGADQIVLGCTHYHWIEEEVNQLTSQKAAVLQPEPMIIAQLERQLGLSPQS